MPAPSRRRRGWHGVVIVPYDQVCADAAAKSEGNDNDAVPASPAP